MEQNSGVDQFRYQGGASPSVSVPPTPESTEIEQPIIKWQASEFIDHQKSANWYLFLIVGAVVGCAIMYLVTQSIFSSAVVLLALLTFGQIARQKPRTLSYSLLGSSIHVGDKSYSYDDFRTFSVVQDGGLPSISLQPIKRFMPILTIYFPPADGEKIFDALASHIPHEQRKDDAVERLMRRIRF